MKNRVLIKLSQAFLMIGAVLFLAACGIDISPDNDESEATPTPTAAITPTQANAATATLTSTTTITPTQTLTVLPTLTPSVTITNSATPTLIETATITASMTSTVTLTPTVIPSLETGLPALIISEVNDSYFSNTMRWFELYNTSHQTLNLSAYKIRSFSTDGANLNEHTFNLSSLSIPPAGYVVVRAQSLDENFIDGERLTYVEDGVHRPYWGDVGYLELIQISDNSVVDFITFGNNYSSNDANAWSGEAVVGFNHSNGNSYASLSRTMPFSDNNDASDWQLRSFSTPGGANDVTCSEDLDLDGIPDCSEQEGSTFAGLDLYAMGARVNQVDVFIEVDYMDATANGTQSIDLGLIPQREALQKIVDAFALKNISVHFDVGDLYDLSAGIDAADFDLGGGNEVPFASNMSYNDLVGAVNFYEYKHQYFDPTRLQIFHYAIFVEEIDQGGPAGQAEILGNDLMIAWGGSGLNRDSSSNENWMLNVTAKTFMHELGHNLGLYHGGNDSVNYKPNYVSIMNYLYGYGLPNKANPDGGHYYYQFHQSGKPCSIDYWDLQNNPQDTHYFSTPLDYSDGSSSDLNESALNENNGLSRSGAQAVDWDCDGNIESNVTFDINGDGNQTTLSDYDDWGNLDFVFQRQFSGTQESRIGKTDPEMILMPDHVGSDVGQWVE